MTVGERIRQRRKELGLSQTELAKRGGYTSKSDISKMENAGDEIGMNRVERIAEVLGVTPAYLLGWEMPKPSASAMDIARAFEEADQETKEMVKRLLSYKSLLEKVMKDTEVDHGKD